MPLLGGLGIALPFLLLSFVVGVGGYVVFANWKWLWLQHRESFDLQFSLAGWRGECVVLALARRAVLALGMLDDTKGMRARWKLLGQVLIAAFVCLSGFRLTDVSVPFVGAVELGSGMGTLITVLWIVGLINAFKPHRRHRWTGDRYSPDWLRGADASQHCPGQRVRWHSPVPPCRAACWRSLCTISLPLGSFSATRASMFLGYALAMMSLLGAQKSETAVIILAPMLALGFPRVRDPCLHPSEIHQGRTHFSRATTFTRTTGYCVRVFAASGRSDPLCNRVASCDRRRLGLL